MFRLSHIRKRYGAMRAVDGVSLTARAGEILAVVGENGAGKTTLMRIAAGEVSPDEGSVEIEGRVELVHQHFLLVDELTIAENLALASPGTRFATRTTLDRNAEAMIAASGIRIAGVTRRVGELSVGEKSKLELVKAIVRKPSVLILDEPTAVLTPLESNELFDVMRQLAAGGTAVVFISHKLAEVLAVASRIVVMRAGRVVAERAAAGTSAEELARAMVELPELTESVLSPSANAQASATKPVDKPAASSPLFRDGELALHHGEIVAIVGVAGNGQTELARRLRDQLKAGGHIPEDRTHDGLVAQMSVAENLALKSKRWSPRKAVNHARQMIALYSIRAEGPRQPAGSLSGGNQQKVILARELDPRPAIVVAAEPTRGLDVESTRFVHGQLRAAAAAGAAILLMTSDLDEAFALADGVHVIYRGRLTPRMTPDVAAHRVASLMAGIA